MRLTPSNEQGLSSRFAAAWRLAVALTCVLAIGGLGASTASAGRLFLGNSVYRMSAKGTNGYRIRLSTYENSRYHRISLTAENETGQFARYNVEGKPHDGRINAVFPGLGEIDVKMMARRITSTPARPTATAVQR